MKGNLEKLELSVDEDLLLAGEELFEKIAPVALSEVDKNFWVGKAAAQEIEIQIAGKKILNYTCECADYLKEGNCAHIVAGLLQLRKIRQEKKKTEKPAKPKKSGKRLTVASIIDSASREELIEFITEYARKDQQFTTALKARFATTVQHLDLEEKYANLLNTILKSNQSANKSFPRSGAKKIVDALEVLLQQAGYQLAEKHYLEVFEISGSIIQQTLPILPRVTAHRNDLLATVEAAFLLLIKLSECPIPPAMKDKVAGFLVQVLQKRLFNFPKIEVLFLSLLSKYSEREDLKNAFEVETSRRFHNREMEAKLFLYFAHVLTKSDDKEGFFFLMDRMKERSWLMQNLVDLSYDWNLWALTRTLAHTALQDRLSEPWVERLEEILLQIAIREKRKDEQKALSASRLLATQHWQYYEYFKAAGPGKRELENLIARVKTIPDHERKWPLLGAIYAEENNMEALLALLEEADSVELLQRFYTNVAKDFETRAKTVAWQITERFLQTHVGRPPSVKIRNFIRHLFLENHGKTARWLLSKIRKQYGDRNSIEEELGIFR